DAAADLSDEAAPEVDVPTSSGSDGSVFSTSDEATTDGEVSDAELDSTFDDSASDDGASDDSAFEADADAVAEEDQSAALEWLASPEVVAGRPTVETPLITQAAVAAPADVESTAVASPVLDVVNGVLNPAGDGPGTPPTGSPLEWAAAAAARRELGIFGNPITVDPTIGFPAGVIVGDINAENSNGNALTYTVTSGPDSGKAFVNPTPADPVSNPYAAEVAGKFTYLPDSSLLVSRGTDEFTVMVSELSGLMTLLESIPVLGTFVKPIVLGLQQTPIIGDLLQPIIGYRTFATIDVNVDELVPVGAPAAFTTMVTSFDGVQISTNIFPAAGLMEGETAPTVLNGPGLGASGNIDANSVWTIQGMVPGVMSLRDAGYNYISWDPRGEHASGGFLQLDNPFFEGRDVQHIIDYAATLSQTELDGVGDPTMGMVGGSYGGGIQLVTAGIDDRLEAIVPTIAWNSLNQSLYPTADFKTAWAAVLGLALVTTGARVNSQIYPALIQGSLLGFLNESQQAILSSSGPTVLVESITAPTLLIQGTVDGLFPLEQASINAELLAANDIPVDVIWFCGGHGVCLDPQKPALGSQPGVYTLQGELNMESTLNWLDKYVNGNELVPTGPRFEWFDQNGDYHSSDLLPTDPAFYGDPFVTTDVAGGFLLAQPLCCGGSGPQTEPPTPLLVAPALAAPAKTAIDIDISGPVLNTIEIVGAPELTFSYSGLGTNRHIYAQLVDDQTNLVLGNIITPVPVDLDGRTHEATIELAQIAYTMEPGDSLTLQIVGATSVYADATQWGFVDVSDVRLTLPTVAALEDEDTVAA
nr:peptidase S15 [Actinomycetes bacterium]